MVNYVVPDFPLDAIVWYRAQQMPPTVQPADEEIKCSVSPITPHDFLMWDALCPGPFLATHIIRTPANNQLSDSLTSRDRPSPLPCTVIECPVHSGFYYLVLFAHRVGEGHPNNFSRLVAARWWDGKTTPFPVFQGWI